MSGQNCTARKLRAPRALLAFAAGAGLARIAAGQEALPPEPDLPPDLPADLPADQPGASTGDSGAAADDLLQFADIPVVVSGSRTEQPITLSSLPISIITKDDIRYSGNVRIEHLLSNATGVDVLRLDRNRSAIGVRGLHHEFADRTLFLVDGRDGSDPFFGGVDFQRLPLFAADIERIEVVRGPGGAAWGANALNGVVNVLTKSPKDTLGFFSSVQVNDFGDFYSHVRYGAQTGRTAWRLSAGYEDQESSEDALTPDSFSSDDFYRRWIGTFDGVYDLSKDARLEFGIGYTNFTRGSEEFLQVQPESEYNFHSTRPHIKFVHEEDADNSWYVRWFGNFDDSYRPNFWSYFGTENDLEGQYNFKPTDAHRVSVGGNARVVTIDTEGGPPDMLSADDSYQEQWLGAFVIDRWDVTPRFTLESQARIDWYSETQADFSGRVTALYGLDGAKRHVVRAAAAKAFRAPSAAIRNLEALHLPLGGGLYGINLERPEDLANEEVYYAELGYSGVLDKGLTLNTTAYYARYERLIGSQTLADPLGFGRAFFALDNLDGADAYGFESEVAWEGSKGRLSSWFAYNALDPDAGATQGVRAFRPAEYKLGATARWFATESLTLNATYRYTSTTENTPNDQATVDTSHRVDLALTKVFGPRAELTVGVSDVFDDTELVAQQVGQFVAHEVPGRSAFIMFRVSY